MGKTCQKCKAIVANDAPFCGACGGRFEGCPIPQAMDASQRAALLLQHLQGHVANGARIESQTQTSAVLVYGSNVNHVLWAILSIFTCGFFLIVWALVAIAGGETRKMLVVDEHGRVSLT